MSEIVRQDLQFGAVKSTFSQPIRRKNYHLQALTTAEMSSLTWHRSTVDLLSSCTTPAEFHL